MIIFRTDGNPKIGAGHIMRCLSIANATNDFGETCLFIVSSDHFQDIIVGNGYGCENLKSDYSRMEPGDCLPALEAYKPSAIFVDSYYVTEQYLSELHERCIEHGCKLVYIDDRCTAPYSCDYLLNYNIFGRIEDYENIYSGTDQPIYMIGTSYAPLRKEFQYNGRSSVSKVAENILVSTGGSDAVHLTVDIVEKAMKTQGYIFHFVVGRMNPDRKKIIDLARECKNIIVHENVKRMDELMRTCDVAISAAGSTLYELCATQTPSVTYVIADNQAPAAKEFEIKGIMKNCGDIRTLGNETMASKLVDEAVSLAENYEERKRISALMETVVDGKGASRILERVLSVV